MSRSVPFISRVVLKNYKSIAACDISLQALTFLVGPNGAGKSNFLDALRFVADALRTSLDHALRERGGIHDVRRRSSGHPTHFGIRLNFDLGSGQHGWYAFRIRARPSGGFEVLQEECRVFTSDFPPKEHFYRVRNGVVVETNAQTAPVAVNDRLYLVTMSGLPEFRPVFESLSRMGFYNLNPNEIRDLQSPDAGSLLARDGNNIAAVLAQMTTNNLPAKGLIENYLEKIVPGILGIDTKVFGTKETLEFKQIVAGSNHPWRFLAANMSDGTLRALGILVALFQTANGTQSYVPLVAIEEPETALHPAATGVLIDCLRDAARFTQVLVTSHSADLLDDERISPNELIAVTAQEGTTYLGQLDDVGRSTLQDHLFTAGALLRQNQLQPNPDVFEPAINRQFDLFRQS